MLTLSALLALYLGWRIVRDVLRAMDGLPSRNESFGFFV